MLRQVWKSNDTIEFTEDHIHTDDTYKCWQFKECESLEDYLEKYMNPNDFEDAGYQYVYDESEDWLRDKWDSYDIERAFIAGAKWMKKYYENERRKEIRNQEEN